MCSIDGEEVPYEDVAKGYELPTGEMVVLTDEDMAELPLPTTRSIEVLHFLPAEQLDPILLNRSYLRGAGGGRERGPTCCCATRSTARARWPWPRWRCGSGSRWPRCVRGTGVLVLETLLWPDEVRVPDFPFLDDDIEVRSQELKMAASLIESMTVDFDPDEYHDNYREALQELVDAKVEGRELVQPEGPAEAAEPTSLADALKASLAAARQAPRQAGEVTAAVKEPRPGHRGRHEGPPAGTARSGGGERQGRRPARRARAAPTGAAPAGAASSASRTRAGTAEGTGRARTASRRRPRTTPLESRTRRRAS